MLLPICASKYVPVFHKENMTDDDIVSESVYKGMPVFSVFFFFLRSLIYLMREPGIIFFISLLLSPWDPKYYYPEKMIEKKNRKRD